MLTNPGLRPSCIQEEVIPDTLNTPNTTTLQYVHMCAWCGPCCSTYARKRLHGLVHTHACAWLRSFTGVVRTKTHGTGYTLPSYFLTHRKLLARTLQPPRNAGVPHATARRRHDPHWTYVCAWVAVAEQQCSVLLQSLSRGWGGGGGWVGPSSNVVSTFNHCPARPPPPPPAPPVTTTPEPTQSPP